MRWKNYLHPNVRRGNYTTHEQLRIIQLHSFFGNRWSKIAEFLPGRTDNDIKNYWRTRVQKEAKQLKYDINSNIWLSEQIYGSKYSNNLEGVTTNFDCVETTMSASIQTENNWTTVIASAAAVDGHLSVTDNLSGGGLSYFSATGMDFQQECNLIDYAFQEIDDLAMFSTFGELSDL
ncbi:hypothetical protein ACS0TY_005159 [Phlomoides rotata]